MEHVWIGWGMIKYIRSLCLRCALIITNIPCGRTMVSNAESDEGMLERLTRGRYLEKHEQGLNSTWTHDKICPAIYQKQGRNVY